MTFVDNPDKKQKHPHYEHQTKKLHLKKNEFTNKEFHKIRKDATHKNLISSFSRISMCMNDKDPSCIPIGELNRVCFILVNTYEDTDDDLGVGPLNDGYLVGLNHHRLECKVFYLYDPKSSEFLTFLAYFLKNVTQALTVYYSGGDTIATSPNHGIKFIDESIPSNQISSLVAKECNPKIRVMFLTDCRTGDTVFDATAMKSEVSSDTLSIVSFSANKDKVPKDNKDMKRSHGIFTYYFCNVTSEAPNMSPNRLKERIDPYLLRFNETFEVETTNPEMLESPIFN